MKRQLNVQQQNAELKLSVQSACARHRANDPYILWVSEVLLQSGLSPTEGILVEFMITPSQGDECAYATWLTSDGIFYRIEAAIEYESHHLRTIESFEDISAEVVVSDHLCGTGKSLGAIALEVLRESMPGDSWGEGREHKR